MGRAKYWNWQGVHVTHKWKRFDAVNNMNNDHSHSSKANKIF